MTSNIIKYTKPSLNMNTYKPYYMEWYDATDLSNAWIEEPEALKMAREVNSVVHQIGYLISETKTDYIMAASVVIAKEESNKNQLGHLLRIPKAMVLKKKLIKL